MPSTADVLSFVDAQAKQRGIKLNAHQLMQQGLQVKESDAGKLAAGYFSSVIKRSSTLSKAYDAHQAATAGLADTQSSPPVESEPDEYSSDEEEMNVTPDACSNNDCAKCGDHQAMIASLREQLAEMRASAQARPADGSAGKALAHLPPPRVKTLKEMLEETIVELEYHIKVLKKE